MADSLSDAIHAAFRQKREEHAASRLAQLRAMPRDQRLEQLAALSREDRRSFDQLPPSLKHSLNAYENARRLADQLPPDDLA